MRPRVIPVMLIDDRYVVKTTAFRKSRYVGDPVNTVKLFNKKHADELLVLDIARNRRRLGPDLAFISDLASEAFMPIAYGGVVNSLHDVERLVSLGAEKVVLHSSLQHPNLVRGAVHKFGSQAIIANIDVRTSRRGRSSIVRRDKAAAGFDPITWARKLEGLGVGEILLTAVDREGSGRGYDLDLVREVAASVSVPVIANGGARSTDDLAAVIHAGASAAAAGSMFTLYGPRRAVLITYPTDEDLDAALEVSADA